MPLDPKEFDKELVGLGEEDKFNLGINQAELYFGSSKIRVDYYQQLKLIDRVFFDNLAEVVEDMLKHEELVMIPIRYDTPKTGAIYIGYIYFNSMTENWVTLENDEVEFDNTKGKMHKLAQLLNSSRS